MSLSNYVSPSADAQFNRRCAIRINEYWAERGFAVRAHLVTDEKPDKVCGGALCGIRSDLVNGLPRRANSMRGQGA